MNSKFWLIIGLLTITISFLATVYYANQIMNQMLKAQAGEIAAPNLDFNAAVASGIFVGIGFVCIIIGLIKSIREKEHS